MGKVNCGFCGTEFSDLEENCPICGFNRNLGAKVTDDSILIEDELNFLSETGTLERKNKPIFNYDEVNSNEDEESDEEEDAYDYDEDDDEEHPKSNTILVIILVIIIALLLLATGFVFVRYFLPNIMEEDETTLATTEEVLSTEEASTLATVPCKMIALTSDAAELSQAGQPWLLHVTVTPEDTTDELVYVSEDESVATVTEDGKVVAVGEGETFITITCGEQTIKCPVVVDYDMVTEETTEEGVPTMGIEGTENAVDPLESSQQETEVSVNTQETEASEAVEETTAAENVLKLKESDISLSKVRGITYELTLDCDLKPTQVEWITMNSDVLLVKDGVITVMGSGTTKVIAKYNGQSVECVVRCVF